MKIAIRLSFIFAFLLLLNFTFANVWMDETFDDGIAFDDLDTYSANTLTKPVILTQSGAISTDKFFNADYSYKLSAGQSIFITEPYQDQTNGPFQYFQFAVNVGSIPPAGEMAIFRWNWNINSVNYSFFVKFVSDGSKVDIVGGEDLAGSSSQVIDTLLGTSQWRYITVQIQKNSSLENDNRIPQTLVPHGVYFYSTSTTPQFSIPLVAAAITDTAKDWSINVTSGSLYLDDMYWEGGMSNTGYEQYSNLRPLDQSIPASSTDWKLYE